jgi:hypothetical protein
MIVNGELDELPEWAFEPGRLPELVVGAPCGEPAGRWSGAAHLLQFRSVHGGAR